ncbi:hypothetical protein [Streptomyces sp. NBC_01304]|uniref:hypothetical protein n=1 Tax=Streptomyces sp. NBC_01304 TaxID=2903818 RepID=UPI002E13563C|nr:hypothetical protein OG430_05475 [Streptomyces sp. NBC_01304]
MSQDALVGLGAALCGGALVSLVTFLGNREKLRAETAKLRAEADRVRAETATLAGGSVSGGQQTEIAGWRRRGSRPDDYQMTIDRTVAHSGSGSACVEAQVDARGFGTLMQSVSSVTMRGRRIRMSAFVRTQDVRWAALWMRVDGTEHISSAFDNMADRPITGTTDWREYSTVLDVAADSLEVAFGVILAGRGKVWVDGFRFETVGSEVPTTDTLGGTLLLPEPWNLDFEE